MARDTIPTRFHIGTQKAGSTFLYNLLASHPEVSLSNQTEVHYYSKYFDRGLEWYDALFTRPGARIDTSPKYFMNGEVVAPRIKADCGERARLVLILRNPIDLLNSHYQMHAVSGHFQRRPDRYPTVPKNVVECAKLYPGYLKQAKYHTELAEHWLKHFDPSQIKIVIFERFIKQVDQEMAAMLEFWDLPPAKLTASKTSQNKMLRNRFLFTLRTRVIAIPWLKDWLKRSKLFAYVYEQHLTATSGQKITTAERAQLAELLRGEVEQLEALLGSTIGEWEDFH